MIDAKRTIRAEAKRHLTRIDPGSEDYENAVSLFFEKIQPKPGQVISGYWTKGYEFDSAPLLETLDNHGFKCCLPVVNPDTLVMSFAEWKDGDELVKGKFDVLQPAIDESTQWLEPDIIIVPLLAFDRRGIRLGKGGGYYDATIADMRAKRSIVAVGLAYAQQACLFNLPKEAHDQALDWVITPQGAHYFGNE